MKATRRFVLAGTLVLTLVLTLLIDAAAGASPQPGEVSRDGFLDWVRANAIAVEGWDMNPALAAYLDGALNGRRIVFIGEPGHFFNEKYDVQLLLIRYLADKGYRDVFLEGLGASMAPAVDHFVVTGEKPGDRKADDAEDPVTRYRERALSGWVGVNTPEFKKRQQAAQKRFYHALRDINEKRAQDAPLLRIHPLDVDMMPGGCYHSIARVLEPFAGEPSLAPIRELVAKRDGETVTEEIARLEQLRSLVRDDPDGLLDALPRGEAAALHTFVDCLLETIVFFDTARADGQLNRALVRREPAMFRQVQHAMAGLPEDAKIIMLAHNNHLCKDGSDISRARKPSLGEMIAAAYPGEVFSLWMLHDHGWLLNPMAKDPIEQLASDPERVESILVEAGSTYVLPLGTGEAGERYLAQQRRFSYFSWFETGTLTVQTDAIFFLDEITPLRADDDVAGS